MFEIGDRVKTLPHKFYSDSTTTGATRTEPETHQHPGGRIGTVSQVFDNQGAGDSVEVQHNANDFREYEPDQLILWPLQFSEG